MRSISLKVQAAAASALTAAVLAAPMVAADETAPSYSEPREPCAQRSTTRNAYFGDLHIHTGFSYDALPLGTNTTPADAYRFARGKKLDIPPYDEAGNPTAVAQLAKPLDFAAVTDHAEFFGEFARCSDPESGVAELEVCRDILTGSGEGTWPLLTSGVIAAEPYRIKEICGEDGQACVSASRSLWKETQAMAEAAYDRSESCAFTSFIGYEYTGTPNANNLHRNVIFRNNKVPEYPTSFIDAPTGAALRQRLRKDCLDGVEGCDVVSIPHNSNLSGGVMFPPFAAEDVDTDAAVGEARLRNIVEPLMEIFQHKGNSECFNGVAGVLGEPDELCNLEQMRRLGPVSDFSGREYDVGLCAPGETGLRGFQRVACISPNDFLRSALLNGLQDEVSLGVNSYRMGVIASTDTHTSITGGTDEASWPGHLVDEARLEERLDPLTATPRRLDTNPGGLAGVWAVENSRDALFDAMQRREVFGTSGTRIQPRFFAGWDIALNACEQDDIAEHGYAHGVPMGHDLSASEKSMSPRFLVAALQDPNASPLQRLQLIKGWVDGSGQSRYEVIDVAGKDNIAGELSASDGWTGSSSAALCTVYEDRDFDPNLPTYYYLRVVEVPSWRWSWAQCAALPVANRPERCNNDAPRTIQEMAWTSPIWYSPQLD